ncbi:hypothetical protein RRG08_035141 [Elysia crispata]|uniref:Aminoacyl-tRNA synthetase class II (D/K/N) domain-containing protein n=1 Tax=Elysia crispata TaxID=231223 RepID=A0AAE1ALN5_9GAST|nr:hypothetical protein RRG08_035141 [Elysia crispata]
MASQRDTASWLAETNAFDWLLWMPLLLQINREITRLKELLEQVKQVAPQKVLTGKIHDDGLWGAGLARVFDIPCQQRLGAELGLTPGDLILVAGGAELKPHKILGHLRVSFANRLEGKGVPVRSSVLSFVWVDDFPLFLPREDGEPGVESAHHPFTAPHPEDLHLVKDAPEKVRGQHYDLVLNGNEIGGGSIRIHDSALQRYVLTEVLKEDCSQLEHLLEALDSGCPPHGGIALGLDRLMAIMTGSDTIRDVIAFPKITGGKDPLSSAPAPVNQSDLEYYHIAVREDTTTTMAGSDSG